MNTLYKLYATIDGVELFYGTYIQLNQCLSQIQQRDEIGIPHVGRRGGQWEFLGRSERPTAYRIELMTVTV